MVRVVLHGPSGDVEFNFNVEPVAVRDHLEFRGKHYKYAGFQDGTAHYRATWGAGDAA